MRAIIHARLSPTPRGEESKGGNLTQQVELSQALCDRNGWTVVEVITEKDSSASKFRVVEGRKVSARGEGWRRVVELVRTGTADVVVARHYDRLYRTTRDLVELVDLAEETGPRPRNGTECAIGIPTGSPAIRQVSDRQFTPPTHAALSLSAATMAAGALPLPYFPCC
ncbi:recombinase family protein [Streptomyces sp. 900116325]